VPLNDVRLVRESMTTLQIYHNMQIVLLPCKFALDIDCPFDLMIEKLQQISVTVSCAPSHSAGDFQRGYHYTEADIIEKFLLPAASA
jgi:hypothetical protein